jgi:DNA primase
VKKSSDILTVIGRFTHLRKAGKEHVGLCPLHGENSPSFFVSKEKQRFYCHGCKQGGDVIEFVRLINNTDAYTALEILAEEAGVSLNAEDRANYQRRKESQKKQSTLVDAAFQKIKEASEYVASRGFTQETVNKFRLGYGKKHHSLIIPLIDHRGMDIGYCERFIGEPPEGFRGKYKLPSEQENELFIKRRFLFNEHNARRELKNDHRLFVFEGQLDAISSDQVGLRASIACMQSSLTNEQAERVVDMAEDNTVIVLVPDKNKTGQASVKQNAGLLKSLNQKIPIQVLDLPLCTDGGKEWDMNDFVKSGWDKGKFLECIVPVEIALLNVMIAHTADQQLQRSYAIDLFSNVSDPFVQDEIVKHLSAIWDTEEQKVSKLLNAKRDTNLIELSKDVDNAYDEFMQNVLDDNENNLTLGYTLLDKVINSGRGIPTGWVVDFMARSNVGKTAFALNVLDNVVTKHNVGAIFFSFEQQASDLYPKMAAIRSEVSQKKIFHEYANFNGETYHSDIKQHYSGKLKIFDHKRLTLAEIESVIHGLDDTYFTETPCKLVIIDYLGYIKTTGGNKYEAMSELTAELKQVAKRTNKVLLVLVQTSRGGGNGSEPVDFSSARDSGTIEENADILLGAYRPELKTGEGMDSKTLIEVLDDYRIQVLKNRGGSTNVEENLKFDKPKQIIRDWRDGEKKTFMDDLYSKMQQFGSEEERMSFLRGG